MTRPLDELNRKRSAPADGWMKGMRLMAICGWLLLLASVFFIGLAKPATETFFDRRHRIYVNPLWDMQLAGFAFNLMVFCLALGVAGTAISLWRHQVKGDDVQYNLILLILLSLAEMVAYLVYF